MKAVKILVVDDNKDFCENVKDILELEGYETDLAFDGRQAVERLKEFLPDIVLVDIKMPEKDGVTAIREMKLARPGVRIIVMTGYAVENMVRAALIEGAQASLNKPLDYNELFAAIKSIQSLR